MPKKIQNEQRERAWKMYGAGNNINSIVKSIKISYTSAWVLTEGRRRGFKNYSEYREHFAQQKGFKNRSEYLEDLYKRQGFKNRSEYLEDLYKRQGFKNYSEYQEHLAQQKGFKNYSEYQEHLAQERSQRTANQGFSTLINSSLKKLRKNQNWLAKQIGVSRQAVSLYTKGKVIPKNKKLKLLFSALKIKRKPKSLDELIEE